MLGAGSSFNLCPRNDLIITQENTDNPVTDLNSGVEIGFTKSLVSTSVIYTTVASLALYHSQFYYLHFSTLEVSC